MEYIQKVQSEKINLSSAVSRHSADETVVYKTVDGQPYYLGFFFRKITRKPILTQLSYSYTAEDGPKKDFQRPAPLAG